MNSNQMITESAAQLVAFIGRGRLFDVAHVKLAGLADAQKLSGEDEARVRSDSLSFLRGCLGESDLSLLASDGFLIVFAQTPDRDCIADSSKIQQVLSAFYLEGEATRSRLRVRVQYCRVDGDGLLKLLGGDPAVIAAPAAATHAARDIFVLPVWSARQEAITAYCVVPAFQAADSWIYGYGSPSSREAPDPDHLELDLAILGRAADDAERSLAEGRRCLVGYSVHATTLRKSKSRLAFLNRLHATPERLRKYLMANIADIEPGAPLMTMAEWVHQLLAVSERVNIQLNENDRILSGLDGAGAWSVSFTLSRRQHEPAGRAHYARLIAQWAGAVRNQKIRLRLDNVTDPALLTLAAGSADFITSERLWPPVREPVGVQPFSSRQFEAAVGKAA